MPLNQSQLDNFDIAHGLKTPINEGTFSEAIKGFKGSFINATAGFANTLAETKLPVAESFSDYMQGIQASNQNLNAPPGYSPTDLSPSSIARTIGGAAGTMLPAVTAAGAAGLATGGNPFAIGAAMGAATFGQSYGDNVENFRRIMPDNPDKATKLGATQSLVEALLFSAPIGQAGIVFKAFGKGAVSAGEKAAIDAAITKGLEIAAKGNPSLFKSVAQNAGQYLLSGGKTGLEQGTLTTLANISNIALESVAGKKIDDNEMYKSIEDAFASGFIPGFAIGVAGRGMAKAREAASNRVKNIENAKTIEEQPITYINEEAAKSASVEPTPETKFEIPNRISKHWDVVDDAKIYKEKMDALYFSSDPETIKNATGNDYAVLSPKSRIAKSIDGGMKKLFGDMGFEVTYVIPKTEWAKKESAMANGDGIMVKNNKVYVDATANMRDPVKIVGHELTHYLKNLMPEDYAVFEKSVFKDIPEIGKLSQKSIIDKYRKNYLASKQDLPEMALREEFAADVMSHFFTEPRFIKETFDRLGKMDISVGQRFAVAIKRFADVVYKSLNLKDTPAKYLRNIDEARKAATDFIAKSQEFIKDKQKPVETKPELTKPMEIKNAETVRSNEGRIPETGIKQGKSPSESGGDLQQPTPVKTSNAEKQIAEARPVEKAVEAKSEPETPKVNPEMEYRKTARQPKSESEAAKNIVLIELKDHNGDSGGYAFGKYDGSDKQAVKMNDKIRQDMLRNSRISQTNSRTIVTDENGNKKYELNGKGEIIKRFNANDNKLAAKEKIENAVYGKEVPFEGVTNNFEKGSEAYQKLEDLKRNTFHEKLNISKTVEKADAFVKAAGHDKALDSIIDGSITDKNMTMAIVDAAMRTPEAIKRWTDGDSKLIKAQVKKMEILTEAGQNLSFMSQMSKTVSDMFSDNLEKVQNAVSNAILTVVKKEGEKYSDESVVENNQKIRKDILAEIHKVLGEDVNPLKLTESQIKDHRLVARIMEINSTHKSTYFDKAYELWISGILSGLATHARNITGNTVMATWELTAQRFTEAAFNLLARNKEAATFGEFKEIWNNLGKSLSPAWRDAMETFEMGVAPHEFTTKIDEYRGPAISGKKGRFVRTPLRALAAADVFAKSMVNTIEGHAMAYRLAKAEGLSGKALEQRSAELLNSEKVVNYAAERAMYLTFTKPLEGKGLEGILKMIVDAREKKGAAGLLAKFVVPFATTPYRIVSTGLRKTPLGSLKMAKDLLTGEYSIKDRQFVERAAEQLLAWGSTMALASMTGGIDDDGEVTITGSAGKYGTKEYKWKQQNLPPTSIKIGDKWYNYNTIEPVGTMLASMVDMINIFKAAKKGDSGTAIVKKLITQSISNIRDKTYLQGVGDLMRAVQDPDTALPQYATNFLASWVPNIYRQSVNSVMDTYQDRHNYERGLDWLKTEFTTNLAAKSGFAFMSPKFDVWGKDISKAEIPYMPNIIFRLVSPFAIIDDKMDAKERIILNYNKNNPDKQYYPGLPNYYLTKKNGEKYYLNREQYAEYSKERGSMAENIIEKMIANGRLNVESPTDKDIKLYKKAFMIASKRAMHKINLKGASENGD